MDIASTTCVGTIVQPCVFSSFLGDLNLSASGRFILRRKQNTRIISRTEDQMIARLDRTRTTAPSLTYEQLMALRPRCCTVELWSEKAKRHAR